MAPATSRRGRRTGVSLVVGLVALVAVVVGGALAYRYLFNRPGEAAIQLIPADAMVVVTLDTTPSERQAATFQRIGEALKREGLAEQAERALTDAMQKNALAQKVRPHLKNSFAFAVWDGPGTPAVLLLAVKDAGEVRAALEDSGQKSSQGGLEYYRLRQQENACAALLGDYLVMADRPETLARIEAVRKGEAPPVATLAEYKAARAALPEDANLMVFASPKALAKMGEETRQMGVNPLQGAKWMALGATVRDDGVAFDYRCPMDSAALPGLRALGEVAPVDPAMLRRLPAGAYGLMAWSQPSKYWDYAQESARQQPDAARSLEQGIAEFERETGMSVPRDLVPALNGNLVLAVYPGSDGGKSVDGLMVIDDANGATPTVLAEKLRAYVTRATEKNTGRAVRFTSAERGGATVWTVDERTETELRRMAAQTAGDVGVPGAPSAGMPGPGPDTPTASAPGEPEGAAGGVPDLTGRAAPTAPPLPAPTDEQAGATGRGVQDAVRNKTIVHAQVGNAVLVATSQAMLDAAVAAWQGQGRALAEDAAFAGMEAQLGKNAQSALMVNLAAVMEALRPTLENAMKDSRSPIAVEDIVKLFGEAKTGLVGSGQYDGQVMTGTLFMPLDYDRAIHLIGVTVKETGKPM